MATNETQLSTQGVMPSVNDLVAVGSVAGVYIVRFGTIAEGVSGGAWLIPLMLTTDFALPLLGAAWLLLIPALSVYRRIEG